MVTDVAMVKALLILVGLAAFIFVASFPGVTAVIIGLVVCSYSGHEGYKNPAKFFMTVGDAASEKGAKFNQSVSNWIRLKASVGSGVV